MSDWTYDRQNIGNVKNEKIYPLTWKIACLSHKVSTMTESTFNFLFSLWSFLSMSAVKIKWSFKDKIEVFKIEKQ